jgi:hypothetical protein
LPASLRKKFDYIYTYERQIGNSVALRIIQSKPIGVWEFLIPIVFMLHFMRNKQSREVFIQNYLFTKRHALDAALKMQKSSIGKEEALTAVAEKTRALLSAPGTRSVYSELIRWHQMSEIDMLIEHYHKLLMAEGEDYGSLVRNAYDDRPSYLRFHEELVTAEKKVLQAARETLGTAADLETLYKIEKITEETRQIQIEKIFGR